MPSGVLCHMVTPRFEKEVLVGWSATKEKLKRRTNWSQGTASKETSTTTKDVPIVKPYEDTVLDMLYYTPWLCCASKAFCIMPQGSPRTVLGSQNSGQLPLQPLPGFHLGGAMALLSRCSNRGKAGVLGSCHGLLLWTLAGFWWDLNSRSPPHVLYMV